jgi:putative Holliday junction resolvase
MSGFALRRRMLGVDYGAVRIGLAVSDELGLLAHPLETIAANSEAAARIARIVQEKDIERIVVGLPRHMNGTLGESATSARAFAEKLRTRVPCEVLTWDERLTTIAANRALRDGGQKTRNSRSYVDQVAAQMILQGYLDSLQTARDRETEEGSAPQS